jgi:hypothetical protein
MKKEMKILKYKAKKNLIEIAMHERKLIKLGKLLEAKSKETKE